MTSRVVAVVGMVVLTTTVGCSGGDAGGGTGAAGAGGQAQGSGELGAACKVAEECASAICVGGRCTVSCDDASACLPAPEWICAAAPGAGTVCQCTPSGDEKCDGHDNDCNGQVDDTPNCPGSCPPESLCGSVCVDLSIDSKHCGACDVVCPPESACSAGECACAAGKKVCDGACTDVLSSAAHCGDCGTACGAAEICEAGKCSCTVGTVCGAACVDTENDPAHCGACNHDCEGGGCAGGMCQPVDVYDGGVTWVATDATHVCFTAPNAIMRAPLGSTAAEVVTDTVSLQLGQIALDGAFAYFPDLHSSTGDILKVPKGGGPTTYLGTSGTPWPVAVSPTYVYWGDMYETTLHRVDLDGTNGALVVADEGVTGVAADATHVFWCSLSVSGNRVSRADLDGSNITVLAETQDGSAMPSAIAIDGAWVYWGMDSVNTKIRRVPIDGGAVEELATGVHVWGMAVDAKYVYFTDGYTKLSAVPIGGGPVVDLVDDPGDSFTMGVAVSATSIYWAAQSLGKLRRVAKP